MTNIIDASKRYVPLPTIKPWHDSPASEKLLIGGFGSGKTKALIWEVIDNCMAVEHNRWLIARDTSGDLMDSTEHDFFEECPRELILAHRKKEHKVILTNYAELIFRSFRSYYQSVHSNKQSKLRALNLGGAAVDEASETTQENIRMLRGRLRLTHVPEKYRKLILVSNPPDVLHWLYTEFHNHTDPKAKDKFMVQVSTYDNKHLPADYITNLEKDYPKSWVERYLRGTFGFVLRGDPVYADFLEKNNGLDWNVRKTSFVRGRPVFRDWDFGWHHPAVVWSQEDECGRWRIHREHMGTNVYIWDFAPEVLKISNQLFPGAEFLDYCDPAGNQRSDKNKRSTIQILKDDFKIHPLSRFSYIKDGVDIIQQKIVRVRAGEPELAIDPSCSILIQGFLGGYAREKPVDGRQMVEWEPMKDGYYEHLMDAIRMGAINRYGSSIRGARGNFPVRTPVWSRPNVPQAIAAGMT